MATKKAGGTAQNLKDSKSKRLGVKLFEGQIAKIGSIIVRQRGSKFHAGQNVKRGKDDTLFAVAEGVVKFSNKKMRKYTGHLEKTRFVHVEAAQ